MSSTIAVRHGKPTTTTTANSNSNSNKKKTTQQLILLRHAARCPYSPDSEDKTCRGKCPIHKKCWETKELMGHMEMCQLVEECPYPGCNETNKAVLASINGHSKSSAADRRQPPEVLVVKSPTIRTNTSTNTSTSTSSSSARARDTIDVSGDIDHLMDQAEEATGMQKKIRKLRDPLEPPATKTATKMHSRIPPVTYKSKSNHSPVEPSSSKNAETGKMGIGFLKSKLWGPTIPASVLKPMTDKRDIELGGNEEETEDVEEDVHSGAQEQQSLLQEEINRMRQSRAPKSTGASDTNSIGQAAQSVTKQIKRKAESIMTKMAAGASAVAPLATSLVAASTIGSSNHSGSYVYGTGYHPPQSRWNCLVHYGCIMSGFMVVLSSVAIILLHFVGGDDWNIKQTFATTSVPSGAVPAGPYSPTFSPTLAPVPFASQADEPTMAPTPFIDILPAYTKQVIQEDRISEVVDGGVDSGEVVMSPQSMAYRWIMEEQVFVAKKLKAADRVTAAGNALEEDYTWFTNEEWKNRFALATLYYATTLGKSKLDGRNRIQKTSNWTYAENWLALGVSECEWSFYGCEQGDSLWITDNGLRGL